MKVYICGSITGLTKEEIVHKFHKSEKELLDGGISEKQVVNPLTIVGDISDWGMAKKKRIEALKQCTLIYIQKDWRNCIEAKIEITEAQKRHLELYFEGSNDITILFNPEGPGL